MSEQGWKGFLAADGVEDWVVLHGGATAVFRVGSLGDAAQLAEAVAKIPRVAGRGILLTAADDRLTVRLSRDIWQLEPEHVQLARAISAVARGHGAIADRAAVQEVQLAIAAKHDAIDVNFWRAALGYAPMTDDNAIDPLGHGSTIWMQEIDEGKTLRQPSRRIVGQRGATANFACSFNNGLEDRFRGPRRGRFHCIPDGGSGCQLFDCVHKSFSIFIRFDAENKALSEQHWPYT